MGRAQFRAKEMTMFDTPLTYQFDEQLDAICTDSDPLAILLAREAEGETVLYHEQPSDRALH